MFSIRRGYQMKRSIFQFLMFVAFPVFLLLNSSGCSCSSSSSDNAGQDTAAPVAGTPIVFSNVTANGVSVSWGEAADASQSSGLMYLLVFSTSDNIDSVNSALSNGMVAMDWTDDITSFNVTGLGQNTLYYFNIVVMDDAGNMTAYATQNITTEQQCEGVCLESLVIFPNNLSIVAGTLTQFTATAHYNDGSTMVVTDTANWDSSDDQIATVDANGLVTAIAEGPATISVEMDGIEASTGITVIGGLLEVSNIQVSDLPNASTGTSNESRNIAVDRSLRIHAVWSTTNDGAIHYSRSTDRGLSFTASVLISDGTGNISNVQPAIATSGSDNVYICWLDSNGHLHLARSLNGGTDWTQYEVCNESTFGSRVSIATDGPYVYILGINNATGYLILAKSDDNGETFTAADTPLPVKAYEDVLVDPRNGDVYVIADNPKLFYTRSTDHGDTFSEVINVDTAYQVYYSDYSISQLGNIIIAGSGFTDNAADYDIDAGIWTQVNTSLSAYSRQASVAIDGMNIIHIVGNYAGDVSMFSSSNQGESYTQLLIETGAEYPDIAPTTFVDGAPIIFKKTSDGVIYYTFVKSS